MTDPAPLSPLVDEILLANERAKFHRDLSNVAPPPQIYEITIVAWVDADNAEDAVGVQRRLVQRVGEHPNVSHVPSAITRACSL